jgi:putative RNA 2'-phosphotransferase
MSKQRSAKQLAKLMDYILSRRPDEFGLVTDAHGFIKIKELLKAINEEAGFRYVRRSHLDEILITLPDHSFEVADKAIRSKVRDRLPPHTYASVVPKLLFTCVRQKAHPHVNVKGIRPTGFSHIILSSDRDMAERIGKRIDQAPVVLTVNVQQSQTRGVVFSQAGQTLYLADFIPEGCFTGPSLPKEKPAAAKSAPKEQPAQPQTPGSFLLNMPQPASSPGGSRQMGDRSKGAGKKAKKYKRKRKPPPWRR